MAEDEKVKLTAFESYTQNRLDNMWDEISSLDKKFLDLESLVKQDIDTRLELVEEGFNAKLLELSELKASSASHTEKIEKLEKKVDIYEVSGMVNIEEEVVNIKDELLQMKNLIPTKEEYLQLIKDVNELKEQQNHWATLENVTVCRLGIEELEEVLRELLVHLNDSYGTFEIKAILDKFGGDAKDGDSEHDCKYKRELEEIKKEFYRNELTDKDMDDIINDGETTVDTNSPMSSGSGMKISTDSKPSNSTDASNIYHPYEGTAKEPPEFCKHGTPADVHCMKCIEGEDEE